jgi:hypothetical protein
MFKKIAAALALMTTIGSNGAHAAVQDFTLMNESGVTIEEARLSPSWSPYVGADALGSGILPDGASSHIHFSRNNSDCIWDLTLVYSDGRTSTDRHDLCRIAYVVAQ